MEQSGSDWLYNDLFLDLVCLRELGGIRLFSQVGLADKLIDFL